MKCKIITTVISGQNQVGGSLTTEPFDTLEAAIQTRNAIQLNANKMTTLTLFDWEPSSLVPVEITIGQNVLQNAIFIFRIKEA